MAATGVNRPTNVKQKEQDVNQKLQLYGIYSGTSCLILSLDRDSRCLSGCWTLYTKT